MGNVLARLDQTARSLVGIVTRVGFGPPIQNILCGPGGTFSLHFLQRLPTSRLILELLPLPRRLVILSVNHVGVNLLLRPNRTKPRLHDLIRCEAVCRPRQFPSVAGNPQMFNSTSSVMNSPSASKSPRMIAS